MRSCSPRLAVLLAALLPCPALAQEEVPEPFEAWEAGPPTPQLPGGRTRPRHMPRPERDPPPLELPLPRGPGPLETRGDLSEREGWAGVVGAWAALGEDRADPSAVLTRPRGPGAAWVHVRGLARQMLTGVPALGREPLRGLIEVQAQALLGAPPEQREAAWRQLLARFPASEQAPLVTRLLADAYHERGDLDGALLLLRAAGLDERADQVRRRTLRVQLHPDRTGSLAGHRSARARPWGTRWARAASGGVDWQPRATTGDGERAFLVDGQGVLAVDRDQGLLVWRCPVRGDPSRQQLALARETLVLLRPERLTGIRAADGGVAWERRFAEGTLLHDVVATPAGFVLLLTHDGIRSLQGWTDQGTRAWEIKLWRDPERSLTPVGCEVQFEVDRSDGKEQRVSHLGMEQLRVILRDGRLACLADRVFLTVDGVVACASAILGELLWLQETSPARALSGRCLPVEIAAGPYAVEAVTGIGHLVRLDPLTGAPLELPQAPPGAQETPPWVLALDPLVLLYQADEGCLLTCGVPARPLLRLAMGPPGPGLIHGRELCLPDPEGVVRFDLARGAELGVVPWPLGPGTLSNAGGLLLVSSPRGVAVLGDLRTEPSEAPPDPGDDPQAWIRALDAPDWRTRLLAQQQLASLDVQAIPTLEAGIPQVRTLDARDRARDVLERLRLRRLCAELAPGAPPPILQDVAQGVRVTQRLRELRAHVRPADAGSPELSEQVLEAQDPALRYAMFEILLRIDAKLRDELGNVVANGNYPLRLRQACAGALVELAATGGPTAALRRAYEDPRGVGAEGVMAAILVRRDPELLSRLLGAPGEVELPDEEPVEPDPLAHQTLLEWLPKLLPRR